MRAHKYEEPPPHPADLEGWRKAIEDDRYRSFRMEAVIGAIQALGPIADKSVIADAEAVLADMAFGRRRPEGGCHGSCHGWSGAGRTITHQLLVVREDCLTGIHCRDVGWKPPA